MLWFVLFVVPIVLIALLYVYWKLEEHHDKKFLSEEQKESLKDKIETPPKQFLLGGAFVIAIICAILAPSESSIINTIFSSVSYGLIGSMVGAVGLCIFYAMANSFGRHLFCRGFGWHAVYGILVIAAIVIAIKCRI